MATRTCSECGASLASKGPRAKTCSDKCRKDRSRRLKRAGDEGDPLRGPEHYRQLARYVHNEEPDMVRDVVREELRPIVREALTEETLHAIKDLLGLAPMAIAAIRDDLANDEDPGIRHRAAALVTKYTIGHAALVQPKDTEPNQQMVVHFALPRPEANSEAGVVGTVVAEPTEVVDVKTCDECSVEKPADQFVAASNRCSDCYEARRARVIAQFGSDVE